MLVVSVDRGFLGLFDELRCAAVGIVFQAYVLVLLWGNFFAVVISRKILLLVIVFVRGIFWSFMHGFIILMYRSLSSLEKEMRQIKFCLIRNLCLFHCLLKILCRLCDICSVVFKIFANSFRDLLVEEVLKYHKHHLLNSEKYNHLCSYHNLDHFLKVLLNLLNVLKLKLIK